MFTSNKDMKLSVFNLHSLCLLGWGKTLTTIKLKKKANRNNSEYIEKVCLTHKNLRCYVVCFYIYSTLLWCYLLCYLFRNLLDVKRYIESLTELNVCHLCEL